MTQIQAFLIGLVIGFSIVILAILLEGFLRRLFTFLRYLLAPIVEPIFFYFVLLILAALTVSACAPPKGSTISSDSPWWITATECGQMIKESTLHGELPSLREYVNQNDVIEYDGASRWVTDDCKARITQASMRGAM